MNLIYSELIPKNTDKTTFQNEVAFICKSLGWKDPNAPNWLMICFKAESNFIFPNVNSIGAVGFIQIIPSTARALGTTQQALQNMTPLQYLVYVRKYFEQSNIKKLGQPRNVYDVYLMIHYPVAVGKSDSYVLYSKGSAAYANNSGLDVSKDGKVTISDIKVFVNRYIPSGVNISPNQAPIITAAINNIWYFVIAATVGAGFYWAFRLGGRYVIQSFFSKLFFKTT